MESFSKWDSFSAGHRLYSETRPTLVSCFNLVFCLSLPHSSRSAASVYVVEKNGYFPVFRDSGKRLEVDPFFLLNKSFQLHYSFLVVSFSHLVSRASPGSPRLPESCAPERGHFLATVRPCVERMRKRTFMSGVPCV